MPKSTGKNLRNLDAGALQTLSVQLSGGEVAALDAIASQHQVSRGELLRYAVRQLVRELDAGKLALQTERKQTTVSLRLP